MSLPRTSRTSIFRRGLVVLATAATLLAGGLVAAPAAQASPVVDTSEVDGTVITTHMQARGSVITGNTETDTLNPASFQYWVDLDWTGGELQAFDGVVTLQRAGATQVRKFPVTLNADGWQTKKITMPGTINPGYYRVGIEFTATVERPDGGLVVHTVDVNRAKTVPIRRATVIEASITNPTATDGRTSRIRGRVLALSIGDDGDLSWSPIREGNVHLEYDPDGPWADDMYTVYVRPLTIGTTYGYFSTLVPARDRWWKINYGGTAQFDRAMKWLPQGDHSGCGC